LPPLASRTRNAWHRQIAASFLDKGLQASILLSADAARFVLVEVCTDWRPQRARRRDYRRLPCRGAEALNVFLIAVAHSLIGCTTRVRGLLGEHRRDGGGRVRQQGWTPRGIRVLNQTSAAYQIDDPAADTRLLDQWPRITAMKTQWIAKLPVLLRARDRKAAPGNAITYSLFHFIRDFPRLPRYDPRLHRSLYINRLTQLYVIFVF